MFKFIIFIIAAVFFIFLFFGVSVFRILNALLFGNRSRKSSGTGTRAQQNGQNAHTSQQGRNPAGNPSQGKKVITPDEGEYVDFEEIKE